MKKSEEYAESKEAGYVKFMGEELKKIPREVRPKSTVQAKSTQDTLLRPKALDADHWNRNLDVSKAQPNMPDLSRLGSFGYDADMDAIVGARQVRPEEFSMIKGLRQSTKNEIGTRHLTASTPERKKAAVEAFHHSHPAPLTSEQKEHLTKMEPIEHLQDLPPTTTDKQNLIEKLKAAFKRQPDPKDRDTDFWWTHKKKEEK